MLPPSDVVKLYVMLAGTGAVVPAMEFVEYLMLMMYVPEVATVKRY